MRFRSFLKSVILWGSAITAPAAYQEPPDTPPWRLLKATETEQIAAIDDALNRGLPPENSIGLLTVNRPGLVLPMIEKKIEEVLLSPTPGRCFTIGDIDPNGFVTLASYTIASTGSEEALFALARL